MNVLDWIFGYSDDIENAIDNIRKNHNNFKKLPMSMQYDDKVINEYIKEFKKSGKENLHEKSNNPCVVAKLMNPGYSGDPSTYAGLDSGQLKVLRRHMGINNKYVRTIPLYESMCHLCDLYKQHYKE